MDRRLTAILAADVVGYSRLMGEDEVGTLEGLKSCRRELIDPEIKKHHGRMIKLMGDGALVEFASVVDAVQCAAVIQRRMADRNKGTAEARQIRFRIGVNLGDIIVEGDDIYGDGVNIAARLQAIAEPGGICISGTAFDHAAHKVDVGFAALGEQRLKNIADPIRVYRVLLDPGQSGKIVAAPHRPGSWIMILAGIAAVLLIALVAGIFAWQKALRASTTIRCGTAICKPERRSEPGLFRRRHHRRLDHRPCEAFRPRCDRRNSVFAYKENPSFWQMLGVTLACALSLTQRQAHRRSNPPQRAAHRYRHWRQSMG